MYNDINISLTEILQISKTAKRKTGYYLRFLRHLL
jgi:hypothetical protein